jgi:threonine dehydrogenase-like Zn-dependent dehydrogenase
VPHPPTTQHAIQFTGPGRVVHNRTKAVPVPGPTQVLVQVEAVGICFSDTKLLHAFSAHPRKGRVLGGIAPGVLAEISSYVPDAIPSVPGHEVSGRIVAVGDDVRRHRVGERCLVQTDYRHLPTAGSNAAFGYNFEGGLQEYVLLDERMILDPETGERFLIPVDETPSGSAVALLEPWACVEKSYASTERRTLTPGGRLLVVVEAGHTVRDLGALLDDATPEAVTVILGGAPGSGSTSVEAALERRGLAWHRAADVGDLGEGRFDDIVYAGADADRIEALADHLATGATIDIVLGGGTINRAVAVDVGRIHYDAVRWTGSVRDSAFEGYARIPMDGELRAGDSVAVVGAAGPMGFMHVIRAATSGLADLHLASFDIDDARLAHLAAIAAPLAAGAGVDASFVNSRLTSPPDQAFSYIGVMVPAPALVAQAVGMASPGARINLFAGFAVGTRAPLDLDAILRRRIWLFGTSGSEIRDMRAVLARLEAGRLDTNVSLDAVCGMEGVEAALAAVEARQTGGKIVVYPALHDLGMIRLDELPARMPGVAACLRDGRWNREAEAALLATARSA